MDEFTPKSTREQKLRYLYRAIYVAAFAFLALEVYNYYHFNFGYTTLPRFGSEFHERALPVLKDTNHYIYKRGSGYDGQFYAQLALDPLVVDPDIENALDNAPYRARRILFSWTAWAFGLGNPHWALQAYSVQNALFWALAGLLLLRWLPPTNWQNTLRFVACFFTAGFVLSFNRALLDGPGLFLIALGALLVEANRKWSGAAILGLAGLGKETNLLAVSSLWRPSSNGSKIPLGFIGPAILAALPFLIWFIYIQFTLTPHGTSISGNSNFSFPLVGIFSTALHNLRLVGEYGMSSSIWVHYAMLASLFVQGIYLIARPKPEKVWWRIGVTYAVLMLFLGTAVWEGVDAAPRVLLPMTIAFNLLFTRKLAFLPILLFANALTLIGLSKLEPPIVEVRFDILGRSDLAYDVASGTYSEIEFQNGWSVLEGSTQRYWIWSSGDGQFSYRIPGDKDVQAKLHFIPKTINAREIIFEVNGEAVWNFASPAGYSEAVAIPVTFKSGDNSLRMYSPTPPDKSGADPRDLSFALYNYRVELIDTLP